MLPLRLRKPAMIVRDILHLKGNAIFSIAPTGRMSEAVSIMVRNDIGSLVVIEGGKMAGMLTFREVLNGLDTRQCNVSDLEVGKVMVKEPVCGHPGDSIDHLREVMTRNHIRYLPVLDGGQLLGVISFHDIAKAVIKETSFENRLLKRYIEHSS